MTDVIKKLGVSALNGLTKEFSAYSRDILAAGEATKDIHGEWVKMSAFVDDKFNRALFVVTGGIFGITDAEKTLEEKTVETNKPH